MQIEYKDKSIAKVCTNASVAIRRLGPEMAEKISQRIAEISAVDSVETMISCNIGRCHPLIGELKGKYAVDLVQPYRLIFEKKGNEIQIARIMEIKDYH